MSTPPRSIGGLGKLRSKPAHPTPSISIRFNAASMLDDDDDDDQLWDNKKVELTFGKAENTSESSAVKPPLTKSSSTVTAPVSILPPPLLKRSSVPEKLLQPDIKGPPAQVQKVEEKSLLDEIKDKIKSSEKFTAITKKLEELSADSSPEEDRLKLWIGGDPLQDDQRKKSLDRNSAGSYQDLSEKSEPCPKQATPPLSTGLTTPRSRTSSASDMQQVDASRNSPNTLARDESFNIVDDFFGAEPFEDFTGDPAPGSFSAALRPGGQELSHSPGSMGTTPPKSTLSMLRKRPKPSQPVSMSSLLTNKDDEDDIDVFQDVNESFYEQDERRVDRTPAETNENQTKDETTTDNKDKCGADSQKPDLPKPVPWQRIVVLTLCVFIYLILPLPAYLDGLIMGCLIASGGCYFYLWLLAPPRPKEPFVLPDLDSLPPLAVPEMRESKHEDGKFKVSPNHV